MIKIHRELSHPGVVMTFDNGYTISIMWGWSNYCSHRDLGKAIEGKESAPDEAFTAEIAAWDENGKWLDTWPSEINDSNESLVVGWAHADKIADAIAFVKALEKK